MYRVKNMHLNEWRNLIYPFAINIGIPKYWQLCYLVIPAVDVTYINCLWVSGCLVTTDICLHWLPSLKTPNGQLSHPCLSHSVLHWLSDHEWDQNSGHFDSRASHVGFSQLEWGLFEKQIIMHPPRGPKGLGIAPIGATQGCISIFGVVMVTICTGSVYLAENSLSQIRIQ